MPERSPGNACPRRRWRFDRLLLRDPERYPIPKVKREGERHRLLVAVVEEGAGVLLFRRPEDSTLLAGTWELDGDRVEVAWFREAGKPPTAALDAEVARLASILDRDLRAAVRVA